MSALEITTAALVAAPAVAAIVGDGDSPPTLAIYPVAVPKAYSRPCLVVSLTAELDGQMISGAAGYVESRVQVQCLADDPTAANDLGEVAKFALGNIVKQTVGGVSHVDIYNAETDFTDISEDRSVYRRVLDFYLRWKS